VAACSTRSLSHPQDVQNLLADNPPLPAPQFSALSPEEEKDLVFSSMTVMPYQIGVGDVLQVIGDTEFLKGFGETSKGDVIGTQVKTDGSIYLPVLGAIPAAGATVVTLQSELRKRLEKYKQDPFVSVDVLEYRSQRFFMMGTVDKPGVLPVNGTTTLIEALSAVGALNERADIERAYFVRRSKILPISIGDMLLRGQTEKNILMQHGDLVVVPPYDPRQVVYVLGEVMNPGPVPFVTGKLTLVAALAAAGGVDKKYADENVVRIFRGNWPCPTSFTISACEIYKYGESIELRSGDRILVAPKNLATASRALELLQPFISTVFQGFATVEILKDD
jgi:polysaccharide export outer membrane protein